MRTFAGLLTAALAVILSLAACGKGGEGPGNPEKSPVRVAGVFMHEESVSLAAGSGGKAGFTITPSSASNQNVTWQSSNPSVVRIDAGGNMSALQEGQATVTVTTDDGGFKATCNVTVVAGLVLVTRLAVVPQVAAIEAGSWSIVSASIAPENATNKSVRWSSSDTSVARVDTDGKVTAIKAGGTATITCATQDGSNRTASCTVSVVTADPDNILNGKNIPDPVFLAYCIGQLSRWDSNKDGKLYADEARAVKSIDVANVRGTTISSLEGIGLFSGITYLDCSLNNLTSLDVSGNSSLTELYCNNNNRLSSLDLSGFTALTVLNCSGCDLSVLNLSRCTRLVDLKCHNNDLVSLDLSRCGALTYLDVDNNDLVSLDLTGNRTLKGLICDNNSLRELDLSACLTLTSLDCYNNALERLDLSRNASLIYLSCDGNAISSLDVTRNGALESLVCNRNRLTSISIGRNNSRLRYIHSANNQLSADALNATFEALPASGEIAIYDNPGSGTCDISIATNKNWKVMTQ